MKEIILIGGGGHCKSCIDVIEQAGEFEIAGIVDTPERKGEKVLKYEIIAADEDLPVLVKTYQFFLITVGQIKTSATRRTLFEMVTEQGGNFPVIVSPNAYVSSYATIYAGTIVMHHAIVNAGAVVGSNCIVNTRALVEHDARVGKHCHLATGSIVNGRVVVEDGVFLGSGSVVREGIHIGAKSIIGCNIAVKKNIEPGEMLR
jgi:sugar O-acyltransferase (sialic acid O-acetyltransferase NeuD family)